MKLNLNSDELFHVLEDSDDETILYLAEHYRAADEDTMERIFRKSQQKYKVQTAAKKHPQISRTQTADEIPPQQLRVHPAVSTDEAVPEMPSPVREPIRKLPSRSLLSALSAAACVVFVCLEFYGAIHMLTLNPMKQFTEQDDTTESSRETGETQASVQTTAANGNNGHTPETSVHRETGLIFEVDPAETTSAVYTITTTAASTASASGTTITETTSAGTTAAQTTSATPAETAPANTVPAHVVRELVTAAGTTKVPAATSAQTEMTATQTETTAAQTETTAAQTETTAAQTETTAVTTETEPPQQTEPAGQEDYNIPGFTIKIEHRFGISDEDDETVSRSIRAVPDPDAPQTIEKHYQPTEIPPELTQVRRLENDNSKEYELVYEEDNNSQDKWKSLTLVQFTQYVFADYMIEMNVSSDTLSDIYTTTVNGNPGYYYYIRALKDGTYYNQYVLYWKQDGYVMEMVNTFPVTLEELQNIAGSVVPEP